mgnify:CR=1 FL=1|tara:strand:+ start:64 stop:1425 length:1362 start_codon:yes stop_codon:yes gene_type:complete
MKKTSKVILSSLASALLMPTLTYGADLFSLYRAAEYYDADIAAAQLAYEAEKEGENLSLASLLPTLNGSVSAAHVNYDGQFQDKNIYQTKTYVVSLTQPIINMPSWYALNSSEQNTLKAHAVYLAAEQNLILDVSSAYFTVLREQENLRSDRSQETAFKRQYEQAKEQFDVGLIAITEVHDAHASFDSAKTNRIRSEGNLTIAKENLSRITGEPFTGLDTLKEDFPIIMDESQSADQWVEVAYQFNLDIKVADFTLKTLQQELKSKRALHLPTLDLSANYSLTKYNNYTSSGFTRFIEIDDKDKRSDITLSLNVPLYSGGGTQAGIRQTRFKVEQAKRLLVSEQRQVRLDTRTEYINLTTNIQAIESLKQNIVSRESALEAIREGYKVGTRNIVEVLDAERNYFTALRDYANARFDFVESTFRIKRAAGTLNIADIESLNAWLETRNSNPINN